MEIPAYTFETVRTVFVELFYAEKLNGKLVTPRERTRQQHEQNILSWKTTLKTNFYSGRKMK